MCEISDRLDRAHKWAHRCADLMSDDEVMRSIHLAHQLLAYLNDQCDESENSVKLLALLQVLECGVNHLEEREAMLEANKTATIN